VQNRQNFAGFPDMGFTDGAARGKMGFEFLPFGAV
jgi:hypothetical protein